MTMSGLEVIPMSETVGEFAVPCDFADDGRPHHGAAEWVLWLVTCCDETPKARLACDLCKTERLTGHYTAVECVSCGHISAPARKAYSRSESL